MPVRRRSDDLSPEHRLDYRKARPNRFATRGTKRIEAEVMKLDLPARAALAEKLLSSLDDLTEAENEALWAEEAERRAEELRSGKVIALDGEDVMRRARQAIS